MTKGYSVGTVARMTGVTVRTLHHYDEIGLLAPSGRTGTGYRRYDDADLERLQQILGYRELGFGLDEIRTILDARGGDTLTLFRHQHALLTERIARLQRMVTTLEHTMEAHLMGITLTPEERFEVFGDDDPSRHAEEAERRWGGGDGWAESQRRVSSYTKRDWVRFKDEAAGLTGRMVEAMRSGVAPGDPAAMDLAEEHRRHISTWFYDCTYEIHRGLAELYVTDERFTETIDRAAAGLSAWLRDAILANADRAGS
ncbi:MerR family transcriptional regulator [Actinomadura kijaniata]|uniref:MerR family transcriptional regulator n=1 Tax=Actinomadura kijaniata TaxID=46161 RepID=UPI000837794D|nr:MerR family transcriptional regulator [Actinomadura kijaniata]